MTGYGHTPKCGIVATLSLCPVLSNVPNRNYRPIPACRSESLFDRSIGISGRMVNASMHEFDLDDFRRDSGYARTQYAGPAFSEADVPSIEKNLRYGLHAILILDVFR